jgi:hypothetical protein
VIEQVPPVATGFARQFIRFVVMRIEASIDPETLELLPAYWGFRADMVLGEFQLNVDWRQPDQDTEPAPDPRVFFPAVSALLEAAKRR